MERPEIKDKKVLAYVEFMEGRLSEFTADTTIAKSYLAKKRYVDENNRLMMDHNMTSKDLNDKDEKLHDRITKYMNDVVSHCEDLKRMESMVSPEVIVAVEKKESAGKFEKAMGDK